MGRYSRQQAKPFLFFREGPAHTHFTAATTWPMVNGSRITYIKRMLIKKAKKITDSFSRPGKMPGYSYGLPAWECKTGSKLSKVKGTPCYDCYAKKHFYTMYPEIKEAQYRRLKATSHPQRVRAMAAQINSERIGKSGYFRWHDAGDIQSVKHLLKIFKVCKLTPKIKHWLPTQERPILKHIPIDRIPKNLKIILSGSKVDGIAPRKSWPWTSTVVTQEKKATCPSHKQGGKCLDCRRCWDKRVKNVNYLKH